MGDDAETKVVKRGRGRPPKAEGAKKTATKRAAAPAVKDGASGAKKGRGRPPKAEKPPKGKKKAEEDTGSSSPNGEESGDKSD